MSRYFRIIVAEMALAVFLSNIFIPSLVWADEMTDSGSSSIVQESLPIEPVEIVPTDSGALISDISDSTGETLETNTGFTDTGSLISGDTVEYTPTDTGSLISDVSLSGTVSSPSQSDTGSIIASGTLQEIFQKETDEEDGNILKKSETKPENEILVQFKTDIDTYVGQYQVDMLTSDHDLSVTDTITENNIVVVTPEVSPIESLNSSFQALEAFSTTDTGSGKIETMIEQIKQDPRVEHVQKNFMYTVQSVNDPDFGKLWGLHNEGQSVTVNGIIGTPDADIDYPEAMNYASGKLSTGVIVAVLDTGIAYNHPDLAGHMWNGQNCLSDTGAYIGGCMHGYDFANNDKDPQEGIYISHGTHVAGTIGAITNNGTGIVGITPNVTLMAVKVCNNLCSTSDIIRGINFARYNGAKVINASFGAGGYTPKTVVEFDYLTYQTIQNFPGLFIAAAGNDGFNSDTGRFYPAGFGSSLTVSGEGINESGEAILSGEVTYLGLQNIISVAASDENDNLAPFSNYGTGTVHVAAPGTSIYSTYRTVSSETDYMTDSWVKTNASHSGILSMNSGSLGFGGYLFMDDLRNTLSGEPLYSPGSDASIEKVFTSSGMKSAYAASIGIWCDTPNTGTWKDYVSLGHDSGNGYVEDKKIDEASLWGESWPTGAIFDGREGVSAYLNINIFDTPNSTFKIRFGWHTDGIDDVDPATGKYYGGCRIINGFFVERTDNGESGGYNFLQGTSMAAPHIAGAAALAMSYAPNASIEDIRQAILWSSDWKSQLSDKVMYGRLNVANMLKALTTPYLVNQKLILSGESTAVLDYQSDIPTWGVVLYATGSDIVMSGSTGIQFAPTIMSGRVQNHKSILSGLVPDTTYYYRIQLMSEYGIYVNPDYWTAIRSFRTPKVILQTATGGVISGTGTYYLSGSTATGVTYGTGGNQKLILSDPSNTATIDLSLTGVTITASGTWDGIFVAPTVVATGTSITLVGGMTISSEVVYEIGSPTTSLTLSGKTATIVIKSTKIAGTMYPVYRSDDGGNMFNYVGNCTIKGGECTFTTNHFSQFALGNPISSDNSTISIGGRSGGSGPGGPTNTVSSYSVQLSLQNIISKSVSPVLSTSNNILSSVDGIIISLQKYAMLSYLQSVKYDSQKKASENAQKYLVDPIIIKINHGLTRGQKLLGYDFALHALDTKHRSLQTSTLESTALNIAFQKISDARLKYIRQAFYD